MWRREWVSTGVGRRMVPPLLGVVAVALSFLASATASGLTAARHGQVTGTQIKDGVVVTRHVANGSVTGRDLRDGSLSGTEFADGKVVGPTGRTGPAGADGGPGGVGPSGVLGLEYQAATGELAPFSTLELVAMCSSPNKVVVGGGVGATDASEMDMRNSNPVLVNGVFGWHATARGGDDTNGLPDTLRVWAICMDGAH